MTMAEATRPPERSDLLRVCAELNRLGAKYIVIQIFNVSCASGYSGGLLPNTQYPKS